MEPRPEIRLKPDFFSEEEKVSVAENEILGGVFTGGQRSIFWLLC
jgi:hypothetical protein